MSVVLNASAQAARGDMNVMLAMSCHGKSFCVATLDPTEIVKQSVADPLCPIISARASRNSWSPKADLERNALHLMSTFATEHL